MTEVLERSFEAPSRRFRPYPAYRDSGVEWLGEIPAHWSARRLKYVADEPIKNGIGEAGAYDDPEWPRYVRITDIAGPRALRDDTFKSLPPELAKEAPFRVGDLLLAAVGATFGKSYLHMQDIGQACFAGYLVRFSPGPKVDAGFVSYWTESAAYWALLQSRVVQATIQNFSAAKYRDLGIPLPSLDEQHAIAAFLDRETGKIDALVAKNERLIELLQEKRTALITRAVTKGLDPNVPMKDSGVEWLGNIPAHWEILPLKRCVLRRAGAIKTGPFGSQLLSSEMQGGDVKVYNQRTVIDRDFSAGENFISQEKFRELSAFAIYPGDVLVTTRGTIGRCAIVPKDAEQGILHPCLMRIQPDPGRLLREYLALLIQDSYLLQTQLGLASNATTIEVIYSNTMSCVLVQRPPLNEQAAIVIWINERTTQIDGFIGKVSEGIDCLKEYRTALISAAVTGKIDVREEAA